MACYLLPLVQLYLTLVVNVVSTFFGTIGNVLVIATVRMIPTLQIISNFWLVSLAVADLSVTVLGQPVFVVFLGWQIGGDCNAMVLQVFRLIVNISCSASVLHFCFISVD